MYNEMQFVGKQTCMYVLYAPKAQISTDFVLLRQ